MKAITLHQPWASLIAWGEKQYETRSWDTQYRGLLAIHAGKMPVTDAVLATIDRNYMDRAMQAHFAEFPLGAVLCIVDLKFVVQTNPNLVTTIPKEIAFGNWSPFRFAWKLELVEVFEKPIPAVGRQGFWNWERPAA